MEDLLGSMYSYSVSGFVSTESIVHCQESCTVMHIGCCGDQLGAYGILRRFEYFLSSTVLYMHRSTHCEGFKSLSSLKCMNSGI